MFLRPDPLLAQLAVETGGQYWKGVEAATASVAGMEQVIHEFIQLWLYASQIYFRYAKAYLLLTKNLICLQIDNILLYEGANYNLPKIKTNVLVANEYLC